MQRNDEKLDLLIGKLRQTPPVLHDADALADSIMQQIEQKQTARVPLVLRWVRVLSTAAAVVLLGLLLSQHAGPRALRPMPESYACADIIACSKFGVSPDWARGEARQVLINHVRQNTAENRRFRMLVKQFNAE